MEKPYEGATLHDEGMSLPMVAGVERRRHVSDARIVECQGLNATFRAGKVKILAQFACDESTE